MTVQETTSHWQDVMLSPPYPRQALPERALIELVRQDYEQLEANRSILQTPLHPGGRRFDRGLGTHAHSHLRILSPRPIRGFAAWVGVDDNERTQGRLGSVRFTVAIAGQTAYRSRVLTAADLPERVEVDASGAHTIDLLVDDGGDGPGCDHADWAEALVVLEGGETMHLDELPVGNVPVWFSHYPFSFTCGGRASDELLEGWRREEQTTPLDENRLQLTTIWTDPETGLRLEWQAVRYQDYPALDWVLFFENTGAADSPLLEGIQSLDLTLSSPIKGQLPYRLHQTHGGTPDPRHFEPEVAVVDGGHPATLGAASGRSSTQHFPFFKIEAGDASYIAAVGWSGNWQAHLECADGRHLRVTAGMETTRFLLHPGERVRSPRILLLRWEGDTWESNAQFRRLLQSHYVARRAGAQPLPVLFCNTCFTRGGGWLNETTAANQISLMEAYAPLGLEAMITDAGWFEGGWPEGAGNWTPRRDHYPDGMAPVAAAAHAQGMIYGLWFEPERVMRGTQFHREHPDWVLSTGESNPTLLANFGLREVQDYFFDIVASFMELPGFRVYRQDFNMDPLPYWRAADAPDRQGITEIRYIEGLYAFWDRIRAAWPDALLEECASGGHRIDLETVMRMHLHQKTDYWFDNTVDQASLWGLSQYLPNNVVVAHLSRLDDYSFHSTLVSSLCLGWIADAPDFDAQRAKRLTDLYLQVRHLLTGAWYPLLPYSRDEGDWIGSQYHRPDLDQGLILAFRRTESPYRTVEVSLRGLRPDALYELTLYPTRETRRARGSELAGDYPLTLPARGTSVLGLYRRVDGSQAS